MKLTREELRLIIREASFKSVASAMGSVVDAGHSGMKTYDKLAGAVDSIKNMKSTFDAIGGSSLVSSASDALSSGADSAFDALASAGDNPPDLSEEDEEEIDEEELVEAKLRFIVREILRGAR